MTDSEVPISDDAIAVVLAATHLGLGRGSDAEPLGPVGWNSLAGALHASGLRPAWLLGRSSEEIAAALDYDAAAAGRLAALMQRAGSIAFDLERLAQRGIWVITRADATYPARLTRRLGGNRPPALFGAGPHALLEARGIAVVGSRDVNEAGAAFAARLGERAARAAVTLVSGGARGVDRVAMSAALAAGGTSVGVLTDSLERWLRDPELRAAIADERLTLLTPYRPDVGFSAARAMARNKLIYCLADHAVVIASDSGKGGTWAGAIEALRNGWIPVFVRSEPDVPAGNRALIERGGIALTEADLERDAPLAALLAERAITDRMVGQSNATADAPAQLGLPGADISPPTPRRAT